MQPSLVSLASLVSLTSLRLLRSGAPAALIGAGLCASWPLAATAADYALSSDGNSVVRIVSEGSVAAATLDTSLVTSAYPGWTVNTAAGGAVTSSAYNAGWSGNAGGASMQAGYSQPGAVAAGHTLNWIQVIDTNVPLNGASSPYIDPVPNDDALPFYWTTGEQATNGTNKTVQFSDFSKRNASHLATTDPVTWNAKLYAVEYDGAQTVTVHDGISWGWTMKPATVGSSAGTFLNPSPGCPPATCNGVGTNTIGWGIGEPGSLSFAGGAYAPTVGDVFKVGTLTYHNGATEIGSAIDSVDLDIQMSFANISELDFTYHTTLGITNTPNTDDPIASADFVSFTVGGFSAAFNVLEGATASVDLMATLTSTLQITPGAAPAAEDQDKDGTTLPDDAVYGFGFQLVAFDNPTGGGFITPIPEPSSSTLLLAGLLALSVLFPYWKGQTPPEGGSHH